MKIRAVLPPFVPVETVARAVSAVLPEIEFTTDLFAPGRYAPEELEVLILTTFHGLDAAALDRLKAVRFVQVASTGYDRVDLTACRGRRVRVSNIPVANSKTVAEHVLLLSLALLRDLRGLDARIRRGEWPMLTGANDLAGKVFGIVGMGRIGREVAARLVAFETATVYADPVALPADEERRLGVSRVELPELLERSDLVSLHLPRDPSTERLLGAAELARMKPGAILLNTARAELVDPVALREAVTSGRLRAGLDVYPVEPPDPNDPLFAAPGALFTPHIAGVTQEAQERFLRETIKNVLRFVQGKEPLYRVDGAAAP